LSVEKALTTMAIRVKALSVAMTKSALVDIISVVEGFHLAV
jgi:hypothetical protein